MRGVKVRGVVSVREGCTWDVEGVRECGVRVCGCVRMWVGARVRAVRQEREGPNPNPNPNPNQAGARRRAAS